MGGAWWVGAEYVVVDGLVRVVVWRGDGGDGFSTAFCVGFDMFEVWKVLFLDVF